MKIKKYWRKTKKYTSEGCARARNAYKIYAPVISKNAKIINKNIDSYNNNTMRQLKELKPGKIW